MLFASDVFIERARTNGCELLKQRNCVCAHAEMQLIIDSRVMGARSDGLADLLLRKMKKSDLMCIKKS